MPEIRGEFARLLYSLNYTRIDTLDHTLKQISTLIGSSWEDGKEHVMQQLTAHVSELSNNTPLYALLIALVYSENQEHGVAIVEHLQNTFQEYLVAGDWRRMKVLLRGIGELVNYNVVSSADLLEVYNALLAVANHAFSKQERKDVFVSILLNCLAWSGPFMDKDGQLDHIFTTIGEYVATGRTERKNSSIACRVIETEIIPQPSTLDLLYAQVIACRAAGWDQKSLIHRPVSTLIPTIEDVTHLPFGPIAVPLELPGMTYPPPYAHFELFHPNILSSKGRIEINLPESDSFERYYMYDVVDDLISFFDHNIPELLRYFDENLTFPGSDFNTNQLIMESLVENILRLPEPEHKTFYYQAVVIQMIKKNPKIIPPILGKAFYTIFDNLHQIEPSCQDRFTSWFSIHISNFDYKWNWKEWVPSLSPVEPSIHTVIVQEILEKCVRLCYYERIGKSFPEGIDLYPYMPPQPQPSFKFGKEVEGVNEEHVKLADKLLESLRLKQSVEEKRAIVDEIKSYGAANEMTEGNEEPGMELARQIVLNCILLLGSKSFSHIMNAIERHIELIQLISVGEEAKVSVIKTVAQFWSLNHQFFMITVEKLINYKIIDPTSVMNWIFDKEGGYNDFNRSYIWDILKKSVHKLNNRITQLNEKIVKARETGSGMDVDQETKTPEGETEGQTTQPEEDKVSEMEGSLDALKREQKHLFITIFQKFMEALQNGTEQPESWKKWTLGMMRDFGRHFHQEVKGFATTLEMVAFMNAEEEYKTLFQQLRSIHA